MFLLLTSSLTQLRQQEQRCRLTWFVTGGKDRQTGTYMYRICPYVLYLQDEILDLINFFRLSRSSRTKRSLGLVRICEKTVVKLKAHQASDVPHKWKPELK